MTYRNKKLLEAVRALPCGNCGAQNFTVCASHSNSYQHGRGMHMKANDVFVAALCADCHDLVDGRAGKLSKEEKRDLWREAWEETMLGLFDHGLVKVA